MQQLRVAVDASDEDIQRALENLFNKNTNVTRDQESVLKMTTTTEDQITAGILDKIRPSGQTEFKSETNQFKTSSDQETKHKTKISILRSGVILDAEFKNNVQLLLAKESPYAEILAELNEGKVEVEKHGEKYKIKRGLLMIHRNEQDTEIDFWRTVLPDSVPVRNFVISELHAVPYAIHPGVQRTLQKVRRHFYWKGMTGNIREYVETCPVCQVEKADHTLSRGKLQSTSIPEKKWSDVSLDFVTDLPVTKGGKDSILTVVDKATRMVHLIPCKKSITAAETAKIFWDNVVKLHGVPTALYSDRGTQFTSQFWKTLWGLTGTQLKFSTAYHPQTQGIVERMNAVVGQMLRCIIHEHRGSSWDSLLPSVELAINSLPNSSTGYSPFYLNFGYHPTVPIDLLKGDENVKYEAVSNFVERVRLEWSQARKNLLKSFEKQQ